MVGLIVVGIVLILVAGGYGLWSMLFRKTDCTLTPWGECGPDGTQRRAPIKPAENGGKPCDQYPLQRKCDNPPPPPSPPAPSGCEYGDWGPWSECSAGVCLQGNGTECSTHVPQQWRYRVPERASANGIPCPITDMFDVQDCPNLSPCEPKVNCDPGPDANWSAWSDCTQPCSKDGSIGIQFRDRQPVTNASGGGRDCSFDLLFQSRSCNLQPCVKECEYGSWSEPSQCSVPMGSGTHFQTRQITKGDPDNCTNWTSVSECQASDLTGDGDCVIPSWEMVYA